VKWFNKIMAVMLLVLWVPTTSHCLIESIDLLPQFLCCSEACAPDGAEPGEDQDGCESLESASYKVDEQVAWVAAPVFTAWLPEFLALVEPVDIGVNSLDALHLVEPDLPVTWQFSYRTAAPPRAPSFVS
jgi:hypothetical protein